MSNSIDAAGIHEARPPRLWFYIKPMTRQRQNVCESKKRIQAESTYSFPMCLREVAFSGYRHGFLSRRGCFTINSPAKRELSDRASIKELHSASRLRFSPSRVEKTRDTRAILALPRDSLSLLCFVRPIAPPAPRIIPCFCSIVPLH